MVNTIGTEPNAPLTYALGSEHHHPIMSKLGGHGGRLERERYTMDGVRSCDRPAGDSCFSSSGCGPLSRSLQKLST